jgi:hypothetical protein
MWIGDPRWIRSDFQMIFNGVVATIGSKSRDLLNLTLRDKLQRLNTPVTDDKIGGSDGNSDNVLSLSFGEVHNVTPQLTNAVTLEYEVHDGAIERVIEVRDNGKPVGITATLGTGRFTLNRPSAGSITASIQGDKFGGTYRNTIAALVERIVTGYGKDTDRFDSSDIDASNFSAFDTAHPQPIGVYADGRTNVLELCQQLAGSVDAQLVMSRQGLLRLIQLQIPGTGTPFAVGPSQMVERSLRITSRPYVKGAVMLGNNKNYTVQEGLLTSIPDAHKTLFAMEWLTATAADTTVQADYKLNSAPPQKDTLLCKRTDAQVEAQRQLDMWKVARTVFTFEGTADLLQLELGQAITITHPRFGLQNGKTGIVTSLAPVWLNGHVTVGVLV